MLTWKLSYLHLYLGIYDWSVSIRLVTVDHQYLGRRWKVTFNSDWLLNWFVFQRGKISRKEVGHGSIYRAKCRNFGKWLWESCAYWSDTRGPGFKSTRQQILSSLSVQNNTKNKEKRPGMAHSEIKMMFFLQIGILHLYQVVHTFALLLKF